MDRGWRRRSPRSKRFGVVNLTPGPMALSTEAPRQGEPSATIFALLSIALPLTLWGLHHDLGHEADMRFFHEWYLAFREGPAFYRDGPGTNYPIHGILWICGPAWVLERLGATLDFPVFRTVLKATLVCWEIALIPTLAGLARALGHTRPRTLALLVAALPSTWAVGALFGQIDVIGTTLLIAAAWALVRFRQHGRPAALALGVLMLALALLTKQLTWFSAPALITLALAGLRRHRRPALWAFALAAPLLLFVADPFLELPAGFHSHLHFILTGGGSSHGDEVVASGASVWSIFHVGGTRAEDVRWVVSSFVWGWMFWGCTQAIALWHLHRLGWSNRALLWWSGMAQLAMCTLMTGVHERYFAHAIPLLVLAHPQLRSRQGGALIFTAVVLGVYVIATIAPTLQWTVLGRAQPVAMLALLYLFWELIRPSPTLRSDDALCVDAANRPRP